MRVNTLRVRSSRRALRSRRRRDVAPAGAASSGRVDTHASPTSALPSPRRSARRQRHARVRGAAARPPDAERWSGRMPAAVAARSRPRRWRRVRCADAPRPEAEARRARALRRTIRRARGGGARAELSSAAGSSGCRSKGDAAAVETAIDAIGHMPLPPYIKRPDCEADRERYQTIFAAHADRWRRRQQGLHFTPRSARRARRTGRRPRQRHAARRLRHLQAGARRSASRTTRSIPSRTRSPSAAAAISRARDRPPRDRRRHDHHPGSGGCGRGAAVASWPARRSPTCSSIRGSSSR